LSKEGLLLEIDDIVVSYGFQISKSNGNNEYIQAFAVHINCPSFVWQKLERRGAVENAQNIIFFIESDSTSSKTPET